MTTTTTIQPLLEGVRASALAAGVFGPVQIKDSRLVCHAKASAAPASYRVYAEGGKVYVSLVMADRWLSESVEADLMHTGDKMEDLLEEELTELRSPVARLPIEHYRSDDLLFTFRSPLPVKTEAASATAVAACLLAYEACFRNLGDMNAGEEGE
jgi:hypothetical protein